MLPPAKQIWIRFWGPDHMDKSMLGCIARPSKPCIPGEYVSLAGQSVGIGRDDQAPRIVEGLTQQPEATASLLLGQGLRVRA